MADQAGKEAKAQLKAAKQAEKARRKASTDPADMGRLRQIQRAYTLTHEYDKQLPLWVFGPWVAILVIALVIGFVVGHPIYAGILGLTLGMLAAMIFLVRRTKKATYKRYAGQAGSAEVALSMLPKAWVSKPVIAVTRQQDAVHRTLGPGGLVLIGEGEPGRLKALLASEVRKHERVAYGVKVTTIVMGDKEGQVPLDKLADHIKKLPKTLQANQVTDIRQRLRALDAVRPQLPMPKGPMPTSSASGQGLPSGDARQVVLTRCSLRRRRDLSSLRARRREQACLLDSSVPDRSGRLRSRRAATRREVPDAQRGERRARECAVRHPARAGRGESRCLGRRRHRGRGTQRFGQDDAAAGPERHRRARFRPGRADGVGLDRLPPPGRRLRAGSDRTRCHRATARPITSGPPTPGPGRWSSTCWGRSTWTARSVS